MKNEKFFNFICIIDVYLPVFFTKIARFVLPLNRQVSSRSLYEGTMYGFLTFGWGSCSGCDALLACGSFDRVMTLLHTLKESIIWKTKEDMLEYFKTKDWSLDHYGGVDEFKDFKYKVITMLGGF